MQLWRNAFLIKTTLFVFIFTLLFNPAYAGSSAAPVSPGAAGTGHDGLPVIYLSEAEAQEYVRQLEDKGYAVREGTLAQLEQMNAEADRQAQGAQQEQEDQQGDTLKKKPTDCETKKDDKQVKQQGLEKSENIKAADADEDLKAKDCEAEQSTNASATTTSEDDQQYEQIEEVIPPADFPPETQPAPPVEYPPPADVQAHVGVQANVSYSGGGGNNSDLAKVFFIFAGVVVVAAFIVYAGKYIADIASGKKASLWREVVFNSTFLSTKAGRHGEFYGARLATGFVSNELIQLALVGELGKTNLNLVLNEYTDPTPLNFSASYWMLGASARLHLTDAMVNASYLFLDLMGGTTSRSATDLIGAARFGVSFGLDDHWRLGASLGAQYIGLDEGQGFRNDGSNYWTTLGVELGARF